MSLDKHECLYCDTETLSCRISKRDSPVYWPENQRKANSDNKTGNKTHRQCMIEVPRETIIGAINELPDSSPVKAQLMGCLKT